MSTAMQANLISAAKRKALPAGKFALPAKRKYPLDTAARVRNAPARLEAAKNEGKVSPGDYATAKRAIAAAAKRFGIESEYNKKAKLDAGADDVHTPAPLKTTRRGLHMHIGPNGHIEVHHNASDAERAVRMKDAGIALPLPDDIEAAWKRIGDLEASLTTADAEQAVKLRTDVEAARAEAARPVWIQIAKVGTFRGHPSGPFELTPAVFADLCRNFAAVDKGQVPIDFEHASEEDAAEGSIPRDGAPAQGWVRALDNRGADGLWGLVDWLEPARGYIREGKYKAVSPAIRFGARHPETGQPIGARLTSVALTNRPFLRGMAPVAARDDKETKMSLDTPMTAHNEFMPRMRAALKLHETTPYADIGERLNSVREMCMSAAAAGKDPTSAVHEGVNLGDYVAPMKALMNMPANTSLEELFDAVQEMIEAAIKQHEALYHGDDDDTGAAPMADTTTGETAMADKTLKDIEVERDGALAKLRDAETKATAEEQKAASLSLRLKDAESKVAEHTAALSDKDAEIKKFKDAAEKRAEDDAQARVGEAFAVYRDLKKLTDDDKAAMRITLKADAALFDKLYPRVDPSKAHLFRDLTGTGGAAGASAGPGALRRAADAGGVKPGFQETVKRLKDENIAKGMPLERAIEDATNRAKAA